MDGIGEVTDALRYSTRKLLRNWPDQPSILALSAAAAKFRPRLLRSTTTVTSSLPRWALRHALTGSGLTRSGHQPYSLRAQPGGEFVRVHHGPLNGSARLPGLMRTTRTGM